MEHMLDRSVTQRADDVGAFEHAIVGHCPGPARGIPLIQVAQLNPEYRRLKRVQHLNADYRILPTLKIGTILNFTSSNQDRRNTSFWNIGKLLPFGNVYKGRPGLAAALAMASSCP